MWTLQDDLVHSQLRVDTDTVYQLSRHPLYLLLAKLLLISCKQLLGDLQVCSRTRLHELVMTCSVTTHHNRFTALFPGPPGWASTRRELLDFVVQGEINRGRHTDHPAGRHSIRTNQCPSPPSSPYFYRPDALPATQPTASKHWRQLAIMEC